MPTISLPQNRELKPSLTGFECSLYSDLARVTVPRKPSESLWRETPLGIIEFFDEFMQITLSERQGDFLLHAFGRDPLVWDETYLECVALWGMGSGKDFCISGSMCYAIYKCLCMHDSQAFLGLAPGEPIDISNVSTTAPQARQVYFKKLVNWVKKPRFLEWLVEYDAYPRFDPRDGEDIQSIKIKFPRNITAYSLNSEHSSLEGYNNLLVVFDEVGEFKVVDAAKMAKVAVDNGRTRYGDKAKVFYLSWPRHDYDYIMFKYAEAQNDPRMYADKGATYEIHPTRKKEDFERERKKDPEGVAQRIECNPPAVVGGFFSEHPEKIRECADKKLEPVVTYATSVTRREGKQYTAVELTNIQPDNRTRFLAGDAGLTHDSYVVGIAYAEPLPPEVAKYLEVANCVTIDALIRWAPQPGCPVDFINVGDTITLLKRAFPNLREAKFDKWNSEKQLQEMEVLGIRTESLTFSNPQQVAIYRLFRTGLWNNLVRYLCDELLMGQIKEVILENNAKITHPEHGLGKDMVDVAAILSWMAMNAQLTLGEMGLMRDATREPDAILCAICEHPLSLQDIREPPRPGRPGVARCPVCHSLTEYLPVEQKEARVPEILRRVQEHPELMREVPADVLELVLGEKK
jgi:hypothetical protein